MNDYALIISKNKKLNFNEDFSKNIVNELLLFEDQEAHIYSSNKIYGIQVSSKDDSIKPHKRIFFNSPSGHLVLQTQN